MAERTKRIVVASYFYTQFSIKILGSTLRYTRCGWQQAISLHRNLCITLLYSFVFVFVDLLMWKPCQWLPLVPKVANVWGWKYKSLHAWVVIKASNYKTSYEGMIEEIWSTFIGSRNYKKNNNNFLKRKRILFVTGPGTSSRRRRNHPSQYRQLVCK